MRLTMGIVVLGLLALVVLFAAWCPRLPTPRETPTAIPEPTATVTPKPADTPTPTPTPAAPLAECPTPPREPPRLPATVLPVPRLITPYVDIADMSRAGPFSSSAESPVGLQHTGLDFFPTTDWSPIQAVAPGTVEDVRCWQNDRSPNRNWQVNVRVRYDPTYSFEYAFEPFSGDREHATQQLRNIRVSAGQLVSPGDIVGLLHKVGDAAHVDFGLLQGRERVCPEDYLTPEARESILDLLRRSEARWTSMCY